MTRWEEEKQKFFARIPLLGRSGTVLDPTTVDDVTPRSNLNWLHDETRPIEGDTEVAGPDVAGGRFATKTSCSNAPAEFAYKDNGVLKYAHDIQFHDSSVSICKNCGMAFINSGWR